jgi:hypothetical protein
MLNIQRTFYACSKPVFSLNIYVPMEWDMAKILKSLNASVQLNNCISLINSYTLKGIKLLYKGQ